MSTHRRPEILVCNDDGIHAAGLHALCEVAMAFGDVTIVAPDSPQSGMGHAISIGRPLRMNKEAHFPLPVAAYACSGTPVDCVKLARGVLLHHKPDLLVSGINHGANSSVSVLYSGTMSAAVEGAIEDIPSIGFSLCDFDPDADFSAAKEVAREVITKVLAHDFPHHTALNVNIPARQRAELKGLRITRQSRGRFVEEFDQRRDPYGRDYYWLVGNFQLDEEGRDTDDWAISNGYASICPVQIDMTAHQHLSLLNEWHFDWPNDAKE